MHILMLTTLALQVLCCGINRIRTCGKESCVRMSLLGLSVRFDEHLKFFHSVLLC